MSFWIPQRTEVPNRFVLKANPAMRIGIPGREAAMGGVTTGAAISAMQQATERTLICASTQFVSPALLERDYEIDVDVLAPGRGTSQARAVVRDGENIVIAVHGALGTPDHDVDDLAHAPEVPPPDACTSKTSENWQSRGDLIGQFDRRTAMEDEATGQEALWFRLRSGVAEPKAHPAPPYLAILGDFLAGAHGRTRGSLSLDNVLRIVAFEPTEWVLVHTQVEWIGGRRFGGEMRMFTERGALLAVASQTGARPRS